jgi:hypothetical protein
MSVVKKEASRFNAAAPPLILLPSRVDSLNAKEGRRMRSVRERHARVILRQPFSQINCLSRDRFNEKVGMRRWSRADTCNQVQAIPNHRNTLRLKDFGMFVCSRACLLRKFLFVFSSFRIILAIANGYRVHQRERSMNLVVHGFAVVLTLTRCERRAHHCVGGHDEENRIRLVAYTQEFADSPGLLKMMARNTRFRTACSTRRKRD